MSSDRPQLPEWVEPRLADVVRRADRSPLLRASGEQAYELTGRGAVDRLGELDSLVLGLQRDLVRATGSVRTLHVLEERLFGEGRAALARLFARSRRRHARELGQSM